MQTEITQNPSQLRKRIHRFLHSPAYARAEVLDAVSDLSRLGRVYVFGGAIRDLAIHGNSQFPSDIDIVLEAADEHSLSKRMAELKAHRNRFGGFRFSTSKWKFDVWRLEDTWALREGHVAGDSAEVLIRTTFFDWDAVVYDVTNRRVLTLENYFERLQAAVVDVNLEPNPNPLGNAGRALSLYWNGSADLAPRLAMFVAGAFKTRCQSHTPRLMDTRTVMIRTFLADFESSGGQTVKRRLQQLRMA